MFKNLFLFFILVSCIAAQLPDFIRNRGNIWVEFLVYILAGTNLMEKIRQREEDKKMWKLFDLKSKLSKRFYGVLP